MAKENDRLRDANAIQAMTFRNEQRANVEYTNQMLEEVKATQRKLQREAPIIKERVDNLKHELGDFVITENMYLELKKTSEEARPIRDWILVKVYELVHGYRV
jgi:hypothetical protein